MSVTTTRKAEEILAEGAEYVNRAEAEVVCKHLRIKYSAFNWRGDVEIVYIPGQPERIYYQDKSLYRLSEFLGLSERGS